jgi:hypothetical protein
MNKKTGIILVVVITLICACLPLCIGLVVFTDTWFNSGNFLKIYDLANYVGGGGVCLGILGIIVAVVVGIMTMRKKPVEGLSSTDEPLPPAY